MNRFTFSRLPFDSVFAFSKKIIFFSLSKSPYSLAMKIENFLFFQICERVFDWQFEKWEKKKIK
jgi:hypothetical protein